MNIAELSDNLKGAPDDYLVKHVQQPDGTVPQFMALSELQRRQDMRQRFAANPPTTTVADDIMAKQPANPANQTVPLPNVGVSAGGGSGLQPGNGLQPNSGGIAAGAPQGYAAGGSIWGDEDWNHYTPRIQSFEGQNSYTAQNPHSSARGAYQFTRGTYKIYAKKAGVDPDDWSPEAQDKVFKAFTEDNLDTLQKNDLLPTPTNAYTTHFLGGTGGVNFLKALEENPSMPVSEYEHFNKKNKDGKSIRDINPAVFKNSRTLGDVYGKMQEVGGNVPSTMQARQRATPSGIAREGVHKQPTNGFSLNPFDYIVGSAHAGGGDTKYKIQPQPTENSLEAALAVTKQGMEQRNKAAPGYPRSGLGRELDRGANYITGPFAKNSFGPDNTFLGDIGDVVYDAADLVGRGLTGAVMIPGIGLDLTHSALRGVHDQFTNSRRQRELRDKPSGIAAAPSKYTFYRDVAANESNPWGAPEARPIPESLSAPEIVAPEVVDTVMRHAASTPENQELSALTKQLADLYKSQITSKEDMRSMALLQAGLGIAAGESPYFATNVGRGAQAGIESWNAAQKGNQEATSNYAQLMQRQAEVSAAGRRADRGLDIQQEQLNISQQRANAYAAAAATKGYSGVKIKEITDIFKEMVAPKVASGIPLTDEEWNQAWLKAEAMARGTASRGIGSSSDDDGSIMQNHQVSD